MPDHLGSPVHDHITDAVKTPSLVRLSPNTVLVRFETLKVYAALGAVRHLLDTGVVHRGQTLVDSSSGIYALALAMACHRHGLRCHIVASTTVDDTIRAQLEILGVTVDQMPPSDDLRLDQNRRVARVRELLARDPDLHWMRQYHDPVHHLGYAELADLLRRALPGEPLTVVGSVGTGASSGGLTRALRRHDPGARLVGVQPFGSVTFGSERFTDPDAIIAGIGLMRDHAVFAGLSTGAAHLAARWEADRDPGRTHVVIGADTGHRYAARVFARHREALDPALLTPVEIASLDDLTPPWAAMDWARRTLVPAQERRKDPVP